MSQAAILIGVQNVDGLPPLKCAWDGVQKMVAWARAQGMEDERIESITDEDGAKVNAEAIETAVGRLLAIDDLQKLIIYFAGHGVNLNYSEFWLLSDALERSSQSVNVPASVYRARLSPVDHVIILSDACRTSPRGLQAQGVVGTAIFPNPKGGVASKPVDVFYATLVGDPSLEIRDTDADPESYSATYTDALLEVLNGRHPNVAEHDPVLGRHVIRPRPLNGFLTENVPIRVYELSRRTQMPDAVITSPDATAWVSVLDDIERTSAGDAVPTNDAADEADGADDGETEADDASGDDPAKSAVRVLTNVGRLSDALHSANVANIPWDDAFHRAFSTEPLRVDATVNQLVLSTGLDCVIGQTARPFSHVFEDVGRRFAAEAAADAVPFGRTRFATQCGFKVRGATVTGFATSSDGSQFLEGDGSLGVSLTSGLPGAVLLRFDNGTGALLPAIPQFLAALSFDGDRLVNVVYEPAENSDRWSEFAARKDEIRELRAVAAASSRLGTFRLDEGAADRLAERMQIAKGLDPSLALYAAYAYNDQGRVDWIARMADYLRADLGMCPFDVALLSGALRSSADRRPEDIVPALPLLSQGWALLAAYDFTLPDRLVDIRRYVLPHSLWTLYDDAGVELLEAAISAGEI